MRRRLLPALIFALAALALTACGGDATPDTTTRIAVEGTDGLAFQPSSYAVPAGQQVTVELTSGGAIDHDFVIEDVGGEDVLVVHADPGETATGTFSIAEPGTYTVFCDVPGHRQAGMEATLTVVGD